MNIQELQNFFATSDFSDVSKAKIAKILEGQTVAGNEIFSQVRVVMQEELDMDFKEAGVDDIYSEPEAQAIQAEYNTTLNTIEGDLAEDMAFVEKELNDLEEMRGQVMKIGDDIAADQIRQKLAA